MSDQKQEVKPETEKVEAPAQTTTATTPVEAAPSAQTPAAPVQPKLAAGLFKEFTLGSSLKQGTTGNVMHNMKKPAMDYEKTYQQATKNVNMSAEELEKLSQKK